MEDAYAKWKLQPSPTSMGDLLAASDPVINSALTSYAGGNQGLRAKAKKLAVGAFETYDPKKGTKLRTHLMTQLQPLSRIHREHSQLSRVPERVSMELYRLNQATQQFKDTNSREPSDSELSDELGLSSKRLHHVRKFARPDMAESQHVGRTEDGEEEVFYPGTEGVSPQNIWIEYVHHDLGPVDQKILEWKTGIYGKQILSNNEIARRLRLTPGAVSQRSAKISAKIGEGNGIQ